MFVLQPEASACKTNTTQNQPHQSSNTQGTENKTTDVVIHQHSRKLLMMDILMSETCWAHNKWNKIASDIKLVFHSSYIGKLQLEAKNFKGVRVPKIEYKFELPRDDFEMSQNIWKWQTIYSLPRIY